MTNNYTEYLEEKKRKFTRTNFLVPMELILRFKKEKVFGKNKTLSGYISELIFNELEGKNVL